MTTEHFPWYSSHGWGPVIGAWAGAIGSITGTIFASLTPDAFGLWIAAIGSGAFMLANFGILIYHRIEEARRDEWCKWADTRLRLPKNSPDPESNSTPEPDHGNDP